MLEAMKTFWKDEGGLSTLEYIIGAGVLAGLALIVFNTTLRGSITDASDNVAEAINQAGQESADAVNGN